MKKCKLVQNIRNFKFCYFIFCTIICFIVLSVPASAKENSDNVIRVGSFEETYNVVNENGERSGYGYEYLQDIAGYAGWTALHSWKMERLIFLVTFPIQTNVLKICFFPICLWGKRNITSIRMHPIWILQQEIWILLREKILVCLKII